MKISVTHKKCSRQIRNSYLKPVLKKLLLIMAGLNLLFYCLSLCWGFDLKTMLGFVIGFIYVSICYIYVAHTVENAVNMTEKRAKRTMIVCYAVRYTGLFLICFFAMEFKFFNIIGIIIPQFYPRMAFGLMAFGERKSLGKDQTLWKE